MENHEFQNHNVMPVHFISGRIDRFKLISVCISIFFKM